MDIGRSSSNDAELSDGLFCGRRVESKLGIVLTDNEGTICKR